MRPDTAPELGLERAPPYLPPAPDETVDTAFKGSFAGPMGEIPGLHKRADFASLQGQMKRALALTSSMGSGDAEMDVEQPWHR